MSISYLIYQPFTSILAQTAAVNSFLKGLISGQATMSDKQTEIEFRLPVGQKVKVVA